MGCETLGVYVCVCMCICGTSVKMSHLMQRFLETWLEPIDQPVSTVQTHRLTFVSTRHHVSATLAHWGKKRMNGWSPHHTHTYTLHSVVQFQQSGERLIQS